MILNISRAAFLIILLFCFAFVSAQPPAGYYDNAIGKSGVELRQALHDIIDDHNVQNYGSLHTHFQSTDQKPNGKVWDIYSDLPDTIPPYEYSFGTTCGNYTQENVCYNREHSWPQSWFNSELPAQSDLFHVYPTDGYVNGKRGNFPFSNVDNPTWTSMNGGKLGPSSAAGYTLTSFEPIDAYKGDLARTYFYMSARYYTEDSTWQVTDATTKSDLKPWVLTLLFEWHILDPVSQKETDRNNAVYAIQNNRNPFIDHPEFAEQLWRPVGIKHKEKPRKIKIYPNPANNTVNIEAATTATFMIKDLSGKNIRGPYNTEGSSALDVSDVPAGYYIISSLDGTIQIPFLKF